MKKKFLKFIVLFFLLFSLKSFAEVKNFDKAVFYEKDGIRILHLKGTPYEMGLQHGTLLKEEINKLIEDFKQVMQKEGIPLETIRTLASAFTQQIPQEYQEELKGLSEGAGISYETALLMHSFLDLGYIYDAEPEKIASFLMQDMECSNFIVYGDATKDKKLIHGRNLDFALTPGLEKHNILILYEPENGNKFAALSWAGMIGVLTGINEKKITVGENTSQAKDNSLKGLPIFLLLRKAIQYANTLQEAEKIITETPRASCYNVFISDGETSTGEEIEITATKFSIRLPEKGVVFATNHFQTPELIEIQKQFKDFQGEFPPHWTGPRLERLSQLIKENYGEIDVDKSISILSDTFNVIANKETAPSSETICKQDNLQSVIFVPEDLDFYIAWGSVPAAKGEYVKFNLKELFSTSGN